MRHYKSLILFCLSFLLAPLYAWAETIPLMIPHTGTIEVKGVPFNGMGQFKFAITNGHWECATSPPASLCRFYWTNDNRSPNGTGEPENFVKILVNNGIFSVKLGDTTLTNMQTIPAAVFENAATSLRVWFNDGVKGSQWLSPDRPLAAVPYAYHAEMAKNVVNGGVTSTMIANDAVTATQIADGTITGGDIEDGTLRGTDIADGTITGTDIAGGTITTTQIVDGTITGTDIAGGTITTTQIADKTIGIDDLNFTPVVTSGGNVGIGVTAPQAKLEVAGDFIRTIARNHGYNQVDDADSGPLSSRVLTFTKKQADTGIRIIYSDNFRCLSQSNRAKCQWSIYFNGASCSNPVPLAYGMDVNPGNNHHRSDTFVGTCFGLAA